jgi:succinate-acetate transporter protein
MEVQQLLSTPQ